MGAFPMRSGDTKRLEIALTGDDGQPLDLSDAQSIRWQMSRSVNARPPILEKSVGDGVTLVEATAGRVDVLLSPADTEDLRGTFYHEVEVIDGDGNVSTVLDGVVTISPTLIKPEV